jgi:small subunit ribosomal protein S16
MGAKKRPFFRLVATDSRNARDGRFIEILGYYHPIEKPAKVSLNEDKIYQWLGNGATMSQTVFSIFRETGLMEKWNRKKTGQDIAGLEIKTELTERAKKRKFKKAEESS